MDLVRRDAKARKLCFWEDTESVGDKRVYGLWHRKVVVNPGWCCGPGRRAWWLQRGCISTVVFKKVTSSPPSVVNERELESSLYYLSATNWWNYRTVFVGRALKDHPAPTSLPWAGDTFQHSKPPSSLALNTSWDGTSTTSRGRKAQKTPRAIFFFFPKYLFSTLMSV